MSAVFSSQLHKQFDSLERNDPLNPLREGAWQRFLELGLPEKKDEAFRYLHLRDLYARGYDKPSSPKLSKESILPYLYPESEGNTLVFVNGAFRPELSQLERLPKQMIVVSLPDAMRTYGHFLRNRFAQTLKEEADPFAMLNGAVHAQGAFVYIPPKLKLSRPVHCLQILAGLTAPSWVTPRMHVFVGNHAEVQWVSSLVSEEQEPYFYNGVLDLTLEEGAHFHQIAIPLPSASCWHFEALRATLKRDSHLKNIHVTRGSKSFRQDYRVALNGEQARADLQGIWLLAGDLQAHTHVVVDHLAPFSQSTQRFKGILTDCSQSSFEGKILVREAAEKTQAYQVNHNLILGSGAAAYSKPHLEIFADDVKASHGSTISQLDPAHLFYLKTRGLSLEAARRLLLLGFCKEMIDQIPESSIREAMAALARRLL